MQVRAKPTGALSLLVIVAIAVLLLATACKSTPPPSIPGTATSTPAPTNTLPPASQATSAPTDRWSALLQQTPFPYTTPLPPPTRTVLDGAYAKLDPNDAPHVPCRRCPDYAPEGGIWKLRLDKGILRIFHEGTGWRSIASFTVSGDRLALFNDPCCPDVVGVYTWNLEERALTLKVIEDECAIRLRAMNLTSLPWLSCQPPNAEAAVTDHWFKPPGCQ